MGNRYRMSAKQSEMALQTLPTARRAGGFFVLLLVLMLACASCSYPQEDASFSSGDARIQGTLYLPRGAGPHPAVVLIHGSGPDTREPYRLYAELVASIGVASLIYDKRGEGTSTGEWTLRPFRALADDARSAFDFLRSHPAIDKSRVGLWGGSEGAAIAPWVASRTPEVAFVIMQSPPVLPFFEQNLHQTAVQFRTAGLPESEVAEALRFQRLKHDYARSGQGWEQYLAALQASRREPWAALGGPSRPNDWWWAWYRTKMDVDSRAFLERVRVPIFAAWGERDPLIPVERSRNELREAATRAGNRDVTLLIVPGADHSLNTPTGPNPAPRYLDEMKAWIADRVGE